ncbi:MAG: ABC transporter ATP-binding protein, partial [Sciscionella sp.]
MVYIELHEAYVDFPIFDAKSRSLKRTVLGRTNARINTANRVPLVHALREITLSIAEGDRVALVGVNGAGKSTLLRLLAGIYEPTRGTATIVGRVAPVFDLGVGMDPEITGYENIVIRGLFLGMKKNEIRSRVEDIAEFTELGHDYLSMPLRAYSTGMRVRLALGVVTAMNPEILLLDEGVGAVDASFLIKARHRLHELVERSGLLVFASYSDDLLVDLCKDAIWLQDGRIRGSGS